ncbi:MAG: L-threonylcarbamoyladenylate synthase [Patescibacteria group bacterium]|nr:L-threonylcarbamoyladenylate synthase [Patescibacteria group bacterium]
MKTIKINKNNFTKSDIDFVADELRQGKVIVLLTDTIYGLHCVATNKKSVEKIYRIKKRNKKYPLLILIKSYCMLHDYAFVSKKQDKHIRSIWPPTTRLAQDKNYPYKKKPTTFILKAKEKLPKEICGKDNSLAIRLPKNDFLIKIITRLNIPLVSTSFNLSGREYNENFLVNFKKSQTNPDMVVDFGKSKYSKGSRIIDIRDINNIKNIKN